MSGETGPRGDTAVTREPGPRPRPPTLHVRLRGPLRCLPVSRAGVRPPPPVLLPPAVGPLGQHSWRPPAVLGGHLLPSGGRTNLLLRFRASGQPRSSTASSDKAFEDWLNEDLSSYQG